jgi:hypothetical protein
VRWNLVVSRRTDDALRQFLASQGRGRKVELSHFVEQAVQAHILEVAARQAKQQNAEVPEGDIEAAVDAALRRVRRSRALGGEIGR